MDESAQQLVRLADPLDLSAGVLHDPLAHRNCDSESEALKSAADEIERIAAEVKRVGDLGLSIVHSPI